MKRCSPKGFMFYFPQILASFPRFSFKTELNKLDQKELLPDWKFLSHQKSSASCWRTPFGTSQASFAHSQLYCYKCNHRYAYTFTAHWMYNVELIFRERKCLLNMSIVSFYQCLLTAKNTKTEEENLVLISLTFCSGWRPSTVPKMFCLEASGDRGFASEWGMPLHGKVCLTDNPCQNSTRLKDPF